eukprot:scaffold89845_cov48-Phaeocystis_antarctica.AAC.1
MSSRRSRLRLRLRWRRGGLPRCMHVSRARPTARGGGDGGRQGSIARETRGLDQPKLTLSLTLTPTPTPTLTPTLPLP